MLIARPRALGLLLPVLIYVALQPGIVRAEILAPSASSTSVGGSVGEFASTGVSNTTPLVASDGSVGVRFGLNIGANAPIEAGTTQNSAGEYSLGFSVRSSGNYNITFVASVFGETSVGHDDPGCEGAVIPSVIENPVVQIDEQDVAIDGLRFPELNEQIRLEVDTLTRFAAPSLPIEKSTVLQRRGAPDTEAYVYRVSIGAEVVSRSCPSAFRLGAPNAGTVGCPNCEYPGDPGRVIDQDGYFLNVVVEDLCGNGTRELDEQCDLGDANGLDSSCCTADCTFRQATTVCRAAADSCDVAEACDGFTDLCPEDALQPFGTTCTDDGNVCTNDTCNALGECIHPFNSAPCSDGNFCTDPDVCAAGSCFTTPRECPGGGSCDETADACLTDGPTPTQTVSSTATVTPSPTPVTAACVGDCNANRAVAINEIILGVNIALGNDNVSACPAADANRNASVAINELITAVANALNGCP